MKHPSTHQDRLDHTSPFAWARWLGIAFVSLFLVGAPLAHAEDPPPPPQERDPAEDEGEKKRGFLRRYIDQLIKGNEDAGKSQFLVYPVLVYSPETKLEVGLSGLYLFRARKDPSNRLSEVPLYLFYTFENQYGLWFDHAIFSHRNVISFLGEGRIQDFPLLYYGIGMEVSQQDSVLVEAQQLLVRERVLFRVGKSDIYVGPELGFNAITNVGFSALDGVVPDPLPRGGEGTTNLTTGLGVVHDTRHNPLNVRDGLFGEIAYLRSSDRFISDYTFANWFVDVRSYTPVGEHNVFAAQLAGQFGTGDLPFNELGLIGGETIMRGYYLGRYRDRNLAAAQVEMRFLPIPFRFFTERGLLNRFGASVFLATGTVFPSWSDLSARDLLVTGGAGLRVLTFPKSDIFTRLDVGFSEDGPGFYVYVGEAF